MNSLPSCKVQRFFITSIAVLLSVCFAQEISVDVKWAPISSSNKAQKHPEPPSIDKPALTPKLEKMLKRWLRIAMLKNGMPLVFDSSMAHISLQVELRDNINYDKLVHVLMKDKTLVAPHNQLSFYMKSDRSDAGDQHFETIVREKVASVVRSMDLEKNKIYEPNVRIEKFEETNDTVVVTTSLEWTEKPSIEVMVNWSPISGRAEQKLPSEKCAYRGSSPPTNEDLMTMARDDYFLRRSELGIEHIAMGVVGEGGLPTVEFEGSLPDRLNSKLVHVDIVNGADPPHDQLTFYIKSNADDNAVEKAVQNKVAFAAKRRHPERKTSQPLVNIFGIDTNLSEVEVKAALQWV